MIVASKGGHPRHPAWFHNLRANPETTIQVGPRKVPVTARVASDAERARLYERMQRIVGMRNPWGLRVYAVRTSLARPWVKGYRRNPHFLQVWRFLDIDVTAQKAFSATGRK